MLKIKKRYINIFSNYINKILSSNLFSIDQKSLALAMCLRNNQCAKIIIKNNFSLLGKDFKLVYNFNLFKFNIESKEYFLKKIFLKEGICLLNCERDLIFNKNRLNYNSIERIIRYPYFIKT